jgi:hypothetical protein
MNQDKTITAEQLIDINQEIRNIPDEKRGFHVARTGNTRMQAPPLVAPKQATQERVLQHLLDVLPAMTESRYRAAATYYTLVLLHLFRDGNGRTARTVFGMLAGSSEDFSAKGVSKAFEETNNLVYAKKLEELIMFVYLDELSRKNGGVYDELRDRQKNILSDMNSVMSGDFALTVLGGAFNYAKVNETLSAFDNYKCLNDEEKTRVCYAFIDHNSGPVAISGLAILQLHSEKQVDLDKWIINIDEECAEWTAEDYLRYAEIVEDTKEKILTMAVDAFAKPNDYTIDGHTVAEIATNPALLAETL